MYRSCAFFILFSLLFIGCVTLSPPPDMSGYKAPTQGTAGVYFYQWNIGIIGSYSDVRFVLDGETLGKINTGEYLYFEVPAGKHKYRYKGGFIPQSTEIDFIAGQNYFFRGAIFMAQDYVNLIRDTKEIQKAIKNIEDGTYEPGNTDSTPFLIPLKG